MPEQIETGSSRIDDILQKILTSEPSMHTLLPDVHTFALRELELREEDLKYLVNILTPIKAGIYKIKKGVVMQAKGIKKPSVEYVSVKPAENISLLSPDEIIERVHKSVEGVRSKAEITRKILQLTQEYIRENNMEKKRQLAREIKELRDRLRSASSVQENLKRIIYEYLSEVLSKLRKIEDPELLEELKVKVRENFHTLEKKVFEEYSEILMKQDEEQLRSIFQTSLMDLENIGKQQTRQENQDVADVLTEIENMKEWYLLNYLAKKNRKIFLMMTRHEIPKELAVKIAKRYLARERGVPKNIIEERYPLPDLGEINEII